MKTTKSILTITLFVLSTIIVHGQIRVDSNGKVSIDDAMPNDLNSLTVFGGNEVQNAIWIEKIPYQLKNPHTRGAISIISESNQPRFLKSIDGFATRTDQVNFGRSYGLFGTAGNYTSGWNYGVYGRLAGDNRGAGIFGSIHGDYPGENLGGIPGKFAGFFYGDLGVMGKFINYYGVNLKISDARIKENIVSLDETGSNLSKLSLLNPISYDYKPITPTYEHDTIVEPLIIPTDIATRKHVGLNAQELKEVYPDLVYTLDDGLLSIDYFGFIPILIASINEQQNQFHEIEEAMSSLVEIINDQQQRIDELSFEVSELREIIENCSPCKPKPPKPPKNSEDHKNNTNSKESNSDFNALDIDDCNSVPVLYQNKPNPFNHNTNIEYYLPDDVSNAFLYIFNMQGIQIKKYLLNERGIANLVIHSSELKSGIYLYTLIADGKEVATMKMILTD
jgi:hypothetical protein